MKYKILLEDHSEELKITGYELFTGTKLKKFKDVLSQLRDTDVPQLIQDDENEAVGLRAPSLSIFTFKAVLNVGMLLQSSDKAKEVRAFMLNVVIDVLNKKLGGSTKFINQREEEFVPAAISLFNERKSAIHLFHSFKRSLFFFAKDLLSNAYWFMVLDIKNNVIISFYSDYKVVLKHHFCLLISDP